VTTTIVDESIAVTVSESPVEATGGVLPITLARLTGEFLDFVNKLADTDPSDAQAVADLEALLDHSATAIQDKTVAIAAVIREFEAESWRPSTTSCPSTNPAPTTSSVAAWPLRSGCESPIASRN